MARATGPAGVARAPGRAGVTRTPDRAGVSAAPPAGRRRVGVRVEGTVQGVGFRPYVHRLARELGLGGHVLNDSRGVLLEIEGEDGAVAAFLERLRREAPPLAVLEGVVTRELQARGERVFAIAPSADGASADAPVTPDSATCADCLAELFDPADRRYRYPFVNCTNCGPRFTIVLGVPYDRPLTTMAGFRMCERCRAEYEDPLDRRFHAQPNACPACGPRARLLDARGAELEGGPAGRAAGWLPLATGLSTAARLPTAGYLPAAVSRGSLRARETR